MYFAVKKTLSIGNKRYIPCVSYKLTSDLIPTINYLESKGIAYTCKELMVFESGKRIKPSNRSKVAKSKISKVDSKSESKVNEVKKA